MQRYDYTALHRDFIDTADFEPRQSSSGRSLYRLDMYCTQRWRAGAVIRACLEESGKRNLPAQLPRAELENPLKTFLRSYELCLFRGSRSRRW